MDPDERVDVLRYPVDGAGDRVLAVPTGKGETIVRERRDRRSERRERRIVFWIAVPLVAVFMTVGPADIIGLPRWTPVVAGLASLSLLWWLFTLVDAHRDTGVPELVATDCSVATARSRWNATVVDARPAREAGDGGDMSATWTARLLRPADERVERE
ncbi:hypothetical protein [Haloarchaeobius salinus]|uniref:hypothetical protein n=1 Tax=Haloarchaeobius salinus TaxID=1198298 RepID=UPI00210E5E04|nr:hypothetical protein [Haloarchaeobius salinus]